MKKFYAGIGSRDTPDDVLKLFETSATYLASKGYTLRSGGAKGSDQAFEKGSDRLSGPKEIYLPWRGFESNKSKLIGVTDESEELAAKHHPYFHNLSGGAKKLIARNGYQVLGKRLNSPSEFVICYTPGGELKGGTAQAIKIAILNGIPVFNAGQYRELEEFRKILSKYLLGLDPVVEAM